MPFQVPNFVGAGNGANDWDYDAWPMVNALLDAANYGQLQGFKSRLINGGFRINQRLASSNADDTYCLDRWYVLTQSGAVAVTQLTDPETGAANGVRLTQSQASAQRMGLAQIVESGNCRDLRSVITTLAGRVRLSTSADVRYAVLEWTGTADSVTSDIVNDWTSASYTAGGFFSSTTLNVLACGEVACTAATWRDLTALNATLGASANNIIVFVWTESTVAQNVTLDLNRMQWEPGETATIFELRSFDVEQSLCQRYYNKTYNLASAPGALSSAGILGCITTSSGFPTWVWSYPVAMRASPTITQYNHATGTSGQYRDNAGNNVAANVQASGERAAHFGGSAGGAGIYAWVHAVADAEL